MVDLVLSLDAAGHRGRIVALSRRGLIPRAHADFEPAPVELDESAARRPAGAVALAAQAARAEVGWRAAVDSLRPHSHRLWQSLDADQQRRFLRHARPWWDVHRHRIAPEVAADASRDGRARAGWRSSPGGSSAARDVGDGLEVEYRRRGARAPHDRALRLTCSTAPGRCTRSSRTRDPLLRSLLDAGAVTARPSRHRARGRRALARRRPHRGRWGR